MKNTYNHDYVCKDRSFLAHASTDLCIFLKGLELRLKIIDGSKARDHLLCIYQFMGQGKDAVIQHPKGEGLWGPGALQL